MTGKNSLDKIVIYCDGACSNNQQRQNRGGWGAILLYKGKTREISGAEKNTSNNRMELLACIKALEAIKNPALPLAVFTDSAYLQNCLVQKWYLRWQKNGWLTAGKKPVENKDLWLRLLKLKDRFRQITFHKVAAHSQIKWNERADELAKEAIRKLL
ncbi:MAG: ribonuclease HI [Candidatus Aminicenantes bacterium]|nr:ribonuclease HI [Candidatus Aminicenantes bacterium]